MQLTEGGHFVLMPTALAKIYGVDGGMRVYSIGFCFAGMGSLINALVIVLLLQYLSYEGLIYIYVTLNILALLYLRLCYKFKKIESDSLHWTSK